MIDTSKINAFVSELNSRFENRQSNKRIDIFGDFSNDITSYPTAAGFSDKMKLDDIDVENRMVRNHA